MIAAWVLVALAVLVVPRPSTQPAGRTTGITPSRLLPAAAVAVGAACLALLGPVRGAVAGLVLCPVAVLGLRALVRRGARRAMAARDPALPLLLDLTAAALRSGRPPADALAAAAPVARGPLGAAFERVSGLLRLGAEPAQAWRVLAAGGPLGPIAVVAVRSADSGARLALAFERLAAELRAEATTAAATRAQRAGVHALAPLGACFLPSFVLLGIVPVVVGMARTVFAGDP